MTADTDADLAEIARGLSVRQRATIIHGKCGVPSHKEEWSPDCICAGDHSVIDLGLAARRERWPNGIVRTPLGLALRHYLTETDR